MVREFEDIGVKFYEFDFHDKSKKNISKIEDIIDEEEITQMHIHPFYPFYSAVIASIKKNIPYILYFHGISLKGAVDIEEIFEWTIGSGISNIFLDKIAFYNATKYVYVSEEVKKFYESNFLLDNSKGMILQNSIFLPKESNNELNFWFCKRFIVVSRLDKEKTNSVKISIDFYIKYCEYCQNNGIDIQNFVLDICGTGNDVEELQEYINTKKNFNINLIGSNTKVTKLIENYDVVFGMGRCILEAMAFERIPILIGYDNYIGIVDSRDKKRILELSSSNFSGRNVHSQNITEDISNLSNKEYSKIELIKFNRKYMDDYRNAEKIFSNYIDEIDNKKCLYDIDLLDSCEKIVSKLFQFEEDNKRIINMYENLKKDYKSILDKFNNVCNELDVQKKQNKEGNDELQTIRNELQTIRNELENTKNELQNIKISKFYKLYEFLYKRKGKVEK